MTGKEKCRILKEIRQKIADSNDIEYITRECSHQGECKGTCPRCESELQYLERELEKRRRLGKKVAVAALAAGMALGTAGCGIDLPNPFGGGEPVTTEGEVPIEEPQPEEGAYEPGEEMIVELEGDVAYEPGEDDPGDDEPGDDVACPDPDGGEQTSDVACGPNDDEPVEEILEGEAPALEDEDE